MKRFMHLLAVLLLIVLATGATAQVTQEWVARHNGPGNDEDRAEMIATDPAGNIYVTGRSAGAGPGLNLDYLTVKYNPDGVELWTARYDGPVYDSTYEVDAAVAIAVDDSGNAYVTGEAYFGDPYEGGTGPDIVTIKYNTMGVEQWVARYDGPANYLDRAKDIALDDEGNVYVIGSSSGTGTSSDYVTIKYNSDGTQLWTALYNAINLSDDPTRIRLDDAGNVYVTGSSTGSDTRGDFATVKYNSSGVEQWVARYSGPANKTDSPSDMVVDETGNVYVTGQSQDSVNSYDCLTVKYNSSGSEQWVSRYNGLQNGLDAGNAMALDGAGNVYVTGLTRRNTTPYDVLTIKYTPSGTQEWIQFFNSPGDTLSEVGVDMVLDDDANVYVTGCVGVTQYFTRSDYLTLKYDSAGVLEWSITYDGPTHYDDQAYSLAYDNYHQCLYVTGPSYNYGTSNDYATVKYVEVPPKDVGVVSLDSPPDTVWSGHTYTPQASVENLGGEPATFDVVCEFDSAGTVVYSDTVTVTDLAGGDSTQISFADWTAGEGDGLSYTMTVTTLLEGDINPDNDELSKEVTAIWPPRDVAPIAIITPPDYVWSGLAHTPRAVVANLWEEPQTFDVLCEFDSAGVIIYSEVATVAGLEGGDSTVVEFAPWSAGAADEFTYQMSVTTLLAQDLNPANDTISKLVHAVKAVADLDIQDYSGNLSANTMELTGVRNSIVVGSYIMVNPDELGKNVDLYDGPANVDLGLTYSATDLVTYNGRWNIGSENIDPDLNTVASLALGDAALNIVQVYIPWWHMPSEETFVGKVTVTGEGEGAVNADEFTLKVNVVAGGHGGWHPCSFGGEPLAQGNQLYWTEFGFGEQGFNLYRAEPESGEFTRLNAESMNSTGYLDCDVSVEADYQYKLGLSMGDGREILIGPLSLTSSPEVGTPVLEQNWPNPWMDATEICYFLPNGVTSATLKVYDISGKLVRTLAHGSHESGFHSVIWNGKDEHDRSVSSGVYFYILKTDDQLQTRKMLLLK